MELKWMLTPVASKRDVSEVGLSLNEVFGRPTGFESMTGSARAKFVSWMMMVVSWA
jgi:hypothetical protein